MRALAPRLLFRRLHIEGGPMQIGIDALALAVPRGGPARAAPVVCTDVAGSGPGPPGEPTRGAGAGAMIGSANPRLLALEPGCAGASARDVHDFWRPLDKKEAVVDGRHSVACYLDAL